MTFAAVTEQHALAPVVWVLADDRPGNTTQSVGLAQALGWPYEVKALSFTPLARTIERLCGAFAATRIGMDAVRSAPLVPPWPDLVIAAGWRLAPVARWIRKQSHGRTRVVQMGRKGGHVAGLFDAVVTCGYFRLPPHPRRIEIVAPLTQVTAERCAQAAARWRSLFAHAPHPHVMLLAGGATSRHRFDADLAERMGAAVQAFAAAAGGAVFAITSRRTGAEATEALARGLGASGHVHRWQPGQQDNPYLAYLALADVLVVTGESESMLAEAAASGKPLYIYPLPPVQRPRRLKARFKAHLKDWVVAHAYASSGQEGGKRGTVQPPGGLAHLCKQLIACGIIRPRRDLDMLQQSLIRLGIARPFGAPLETGARPPLQEIAEVARRVREVLGFVES